MITGIIIAITQYYWLEVFAAANTHITKKLQCNYGGTAEGTDWITTGITYLLPKSGAARTSQTTAHYVLNTLRTGLLNCLNARSRGLIQSEVRFL